MLLCLCIPREAVLQLQQCDEFSKLLFKCHNIIRNNDKLSPEAAFDEISKILFIKIRYERENDDGQIFSKERFVANRKAYKKFTSSQKSYR